MDRVEPLEGKMSSLEALGRRIAAERDELLEQAGDLEQVRNRLLKGSGTAREPRSWRRVALLAAAAILASLIGLLILMPRSARLEFTVGAAQTPGAVGQWLSASSSGPLDVEFSDGTRVSLGKSTRARIASIDRFGAGIVIESGRAEFSVVPKEGANWRVTLGPFGVNVTGTRFGVEWDPALEVLALSLHEGSVTISGCVFGDGRPIVAGETVRAFCKEGRIEISSSRVGRAPEPTPAASVGSSASLRPSPPAPFAMNSAEKPEAKKPPPRELPAEAPNWRVLARSGVYRDALSAAEKDGFEGLCDSGSASDLLLLGDTARFARQPVKAEQAYLALRKRFAGDARASMAAFMLARIAIEQKDNGRSVRWLETYLGEQPKGPLASEALGRLIEAKERAGDRAGTQRAAKDYLARFPSGPHAELAQRLLGE